MNFRIAGLADVSSLASARWAFRTEDASELPLDDEPAFVRRYEAFVREELLSQRLVYWLAETMDGDIVAHMALHIVRAIPRPSRLNDQWGYLTDCFTRPAFRSRGVGRELLAHVAAWAREGDLELLVVWPSDRSASFYSRAGFAPDDELRVLHLRAYDLPAPPGLHPHPERSNEY